MWENLIVGSLIGGKEGRNIERNNLELVLGGSVVVIVFQANE